MISFKIRSSNFTTKTSLEDLLYYPNFTIKVLLKKHNFKKITVYKNKYFYQLLIQKTIIVNKRI